MIFETTSEQRERLPTYGDVMRACGIYPEIIEKIIAIASKDQGVFELIEIFVSSTDVLERSEIMDDLKETINDYERSWI